MKKIVLLDIDDCLSDFNSEFWKLHNRITGSNITVEDIKDWDMSLFSELGSEVYELFKYPNLFRNLPVKPYAKELVCNLQKDFDVYLVTDAPSGVTNTVAEKTNKPMSNPTDDKRLWVAEHFPSIPKSNIIFTSKKHLVMGDILVDDKPQTIQEFMELNRKHILVDMPYNADVNTEYRAADLKQVEKMIYSALK